MLELLVPKTGTVNDLLVELKRKAKLEDEAVSEVRIYICTANKILRELDNDYPISNIPEYNYLIAERTPIEDREPPEGDIQVMAFHFDKEPVKAHGVPFKFHFKRGETLKEMKPRLSKRTGIKGKPFENIKFAVIGRAPYAKPTYLEDGK